MRPSIKQELAGLAVGGTCTLPAYHRRDNKQGYRVPPPVYRHLKDFQYSVRIFNHQDGMIQVLRLK